MSPADIDRVFGRARLKMVTGQHVEVYREEALPGERRRYTKRFLSTMDGDFREWTEREWRILARLVGHGVACVPDVVQFDRGAGGGTALVQTYDAGITVDQWATLLPVQRDGRVLAHVFADRAHWWALAHHSLIALEAIHRLEVIHLDIKADNVCIPFGPPHFRPEAPGAKLQPLFDRLAMIDFAFSLVAGEALTTPLPIGRQQDYPYQSPRLLAALEAGRHGDLGPTRQLDWRCDLYSVAAMLARYLPATASPQPADAADWTSVGLAAARTLIERIRHFHDLEPGATRPHAELIALCAEALADADMAASLDDEWTLASGNSSAAAASPTPVTRIAPALRDAAAASAAAGPVPRTPISMAAPVAEAAAASAIPLGSALPPSGPGDENGAGAAVSAAPAGGSIAAAPAASLEVPTTTAGEMRRRRASDLAAAQASAEAQRLADAAGASAAAAPQAVPAAGSPEPLRSAATSVRRKRLAVGMRRLAIPGVIVGLVTAIVLLTAGGAWTALRKVVTPTPAATTRAPATPSARQRAADARPAPVATAPPAAPPSAPAEPPLPVSADFGERSLQLLAGPLPELAGRIERALAPALSLADLAERSGDDAAMRQAVMAAALPTLGPEHLRRRAPDDARRLNEQARTAFWTRRQVREAFALQMRAFGANPQDAEIAGNLAYFHLKVNPPQPEAARQLALHALTLRGANNPAGRWEDWTTLAVASAMTGRDSDARRAFWLTLALTDNLEKNCRAALNAAASYGPRVRPPAEAVLARIRERGQSNVSPYCAWPPKWDAGTRFP